MEPPRKIDVFGKMRYLDFFLVREEELTRHHYDPHLWGKCDGLPRVQSSTSFLPFAGQYLTCSGVQHMTFNFSRVIAEARLFEDMCMRNCEFYMLRIIRKEQTERPDGALVDI